MLLNYWRVAQTLPFNVCDGAERQHYNSLRSIIYPFRAAAAQIRRHHKTMSAPPTMRGAV